MNQPSTNHKRDRVRYDVKLPTWLEARLDYVDVSRLLMMFMLCVLGAVLPGVSSETHAANAMTGAALWASKGCNGCHGAAPGNPQRNAANVGGVITHAITNVAAMSGLSVNATEAADLAAYIAATTSTLTQNPVNVSYHGTAAIPLDITLNLGAVTTSTAFNALGVSGNSNGTVTFPTSAYTSAFGSSLNLSSASYQHTANSCVGETITVTATGPAGSSAGRVATIVVGDPGAPTANTYTATTIPYSTSPTNLSPPTLGGPAPATLGIVAQPSSGTASVLAGALRYASAATFVPQVTFTYNAVGPCVATYPGTATSATQTVTVNIGTPTPTTLNPTTSATFNSGAPITTTAINIPALIGAVPGVVTGVTITAQPATGAAVAAGATVNFTPLAGEANTTRTFNYQTTGPGATFTGTVTVNVGAAGAPVVTQPITLSVPFNAGGAAATPINLAPFITGALQSPNPINVTVAPALGSGIATGLFATTTLNYTPAVGSLAQQTFQFSAIAPGGASTAGTVTINITPPGPPGVTQPINVSVPFNAGGAAATVINLSPFLIGTLTANPVTITAAPASGTGIAVGPITGTTVSYTSAVSNLTAQTFQLTASAPGGATSPVATVNISIAPPAPPAASAKSATTAINTAVPIDLTTSVTGLFSSIAVASAPANGTTQTAGNVVTYTPRAGFSGTDTFTYTATGPAATSAPATVTVTVVRAVAGPVQMTVPLNTPTVKDLAPNITGIGITGVAIVNAPRFGSVTTNGTSVTYTPRTDYFGPDTFTYSAFGTGGSSAPNTVTVDVVGRPNPINNAAVPGLVNAQADTAQRFARTQVNIFQRRMERLRRGAAPRGNPNAASSGNAVARDDAQRLPQRADNVAALASDGSATGNKVQAQWAEPLGVRDGARYVTGNANVQPSDALGWREAPGVVRIMPADLKAPALTPDARLPSYDTVVRAIGAGSQSGGGLVLANFVGDLMNVAKNRSMNVAQLGGGTGATDVSPLGSNGVSYWMDGTFNFGKRDATATRSSTDFSTNGVSVGADYRLTDKLVLGAGIGFARDRTSIGTDGSQSRSQGYSAAAYGSFQPTQNTFIDGLLGVGTLRFDSTRFVPAVTDYARANRSGSQLFGALIGGYEHKRNGMMWSPYGRVDFTVDRLNQATETGAGLNALTYFAQTQKSVQSAAGLLLESAHEASFGWVAPRVRTEYRYDMQGTRQATIAYADEFLTGPRYGLTTGPLERKTIVGGIGADFILRSGLTLGFDYQLNYSSSQSRSQTVRVRLELPFDGKVRKPNIFEGGDSADSLNLQFDGGYTFDTNVNRASASAQRLSDQSFSANVGTNGVFSLSDKIRAVLSGSIGGEKFKAYDRLSKAVLNANAELQYRTSGGFDAPTFALFGKGFLERFDSDNRDGHRYSMGVSVLQPVTDRITVFGALAHDIRYARNSVFDGKFDSAKLNLDYVLHKDGTTYLTGEYRRGDTVSTAVPTLANLNIAKLFTADDVFGRNLVSYRIDAKTWISTLGYNVGFGPRNSLDFSWRMAQSVPTRSPTFAAPGFRYVVNQFNIVYLMRF